MNKFFLLAKKIASIFLMLAFLFSFLVEGVLAQETEYHCEDPHSHPVGDQCYCDDGYINHNGKCRDPYAVCRGYNATYSPAIKNCKCADGYQEKNNYCVRIEEDKIETNVSVESKEEVKEETVVNKDTVNESKIDVGDKDDVLKSKSVVQDKVNSLMNKYYSKHDEKTQQIIEKSSEKIEEMQDDNLKPQQDIYADIDSDSGGKIVLAPFEIPIEDSFSFLSESEKEEAESQMDTISDFSASDDEEISLKKDEKDTLEKVKENIVEESLKKKKDDWKKALEKAEKEKKLKEGITKEQFDTEKEMEARLKWQIATIKKSIGFEHMRIIEVTGIVKPDKMPQPIAFERMAGDYREYFDNKSAVSNEGGELAGVVFEKSVKNITGMNKQLEDLKKALKEQYPENWQKKYLDVSEEPNKEKQEEEIAKVGLFKFIEKNSKKD